MRSGRGFVVAGLAVAGAFAVASGWVASSFPDGLEKAAERLGFADRANPGPVPGAPMPDYKVPAAGEGPWSGALAGAAGVVLTFIVAWIAGRVLRPKGNAARLHR